MVEIQHFVSFLGYGFKQRSCFNMTLDVDETLNWALTATNQQLHTTRVSLHHLFKGVRWRSGRASDSESRGPGFDLHKSHRVVSLSKTQFLPTVLVKPRKRWLHPNMTEKLLTGTLSLNTNKHHQFISFGKHLTSVS